MKCGTCGNECVWTWRGKCLGCASASASVTEEEHLREEFVRGKFAALSSLARRLKVAERRESPPTEGSAT